MSRKITRRQLAAMIREEARLQRRLMEQHSSSTWHNDYDEDEEEEFISTRRPRTKVRKSKRHKDIRMKANQNEQAEYQGDYESYIDSLDDFDSDMSDIDSFIASKGGRRYVDDEEWDSDPEFESLFDDYDDTYRPKKKFRGRNYDDDDYEEW